ncbi:sigma-70 family RNA polymerase sigma factor [uncultured Clostridium sp.]|uniref:sigma-70 family RNA polymerase sigma factor n=1 Tax=uncultured Clostridium sp. TaxID=59620 RepID=UPI0028E77F6F|nr:sigma-70 family RNA polymerase sigma factor [uncultured Clostridium sp.]
MKVTENNFIDELKCKNELALDYIYSKYVNLVYKVVLDVLGNVATKEDIEECVSDIFITVWKNTSKYNAHVTPFNKWLIAVSKYKAIDYLIKLNRCEETIELVENISMSKDNIEDKIIRQGEMTVLYKMIMAMNEIDRDIFIKRYFLNEDIVDIARHLHMPRSAIDNRLSRGRKVIKNKWQKIIGR